MTDDQIRADAAWLARLARGTSWPAEMAQRVEDAADRVEKWAAPSPDVERAERAARPLIGHMMTLAFIASFPDEPKYQEQWASRLQGMAMQGLVWRFPDKPWEPTAYGQSLLPEFPDGATPEDVAATVHALYSAPASPVPEVQPDPGEEVER